MIYVFGPVNSSSDGIVSAVVAAHWLTTRSRPARAWRHNEPDDLTRFIFRQSGLALPERLKFLPACDPVWLTGFSNTSQGPDGLENCNISGIIDHHPLQGLSTHATPEVWIQPVGSCSTSLWMLMNRQIRSALAPAHAVLLLGGIIEATANLKSPLTTDEDRYSAAELSVLCGISRKTYARSLMSTAPPASA